MFISFDGIEGCGKSSQAYKLVERLEGSGLFCVSTKEPGSILNKECKQIRQLILDPENDIAHRSEFFLYLADRAQHVERCIKPALDNGYVVVSDRYIDSTLIYQGIGRGLGIGVVKPFIAYASQDLIPDLTFILDLPAEKGLQRAIESNVEFAGGDRMEREDIEFHKKLRHGFLDIAKMEPRYVVIDATRDIDTIHEEVFQAVSEKLEVFNDNK